MKQTRTLRRLPLAMAGAFALLNIFMYLTIERFWIGGSSFLPMVGIFGPENKFIFALTVNLGVIIGAFIGAISNDEFIFRLPRRSNIPRAILGGILIGIGVTLAPGTCTTCFVTGMPMLSISSFLSAAGIFIGAYAVYRLVEGRP